MGQQQTGAAKGGEETSAEAEEEQAVAKRPRFKSGAAAGGRCKGETSAEVEEEADDA